MESGVARVEEELRGVRDLTPGMSMGVRGRGVGKGEEETGVVMRGGGGGTGLYKASKSFSPSGNCRGDHGRTWGTHCSTSVGKVGEVRTLRCCFPLLENGFGLPRELPSGVEAKDCGLLRFRWPPEMKLRKRFFSLTSHFS